MPPHRIQIFGERCSGTNWIAELLRRNLPGIRIVDDFGWKHGWPPEHPGPSPDCIFVIVHRDPFDWLQSLHRMPWHAAPELRGVPFGQFVRTPWRCLWGADVDSVDEDRRGTEMLHERDPATGAPFANAMRLRAAKARAWDALRSVVTHHLGVRYEGVLADPRAFVRDFAVRFGLRRWPWFRAVTTWKGGRDKFVPKAAPPIQPSDLAWILSELDIDLERAHGYDVTARVVALSGGSTGAIA